MGTGTGKDTGQGGRTALADWSGCAQRHYQDSKVREAPAVLQYGLLEVRIDDPPETLGCASNLSLILGANSLEKGYTAASEASRIRSQ